MISSIQFGLGLAAAWIIAYGIYWKRAKHDAALPSRDPFSLTLNRRDKLVAYEWGQDNLSNVERQKLLHILRDELGWPNALFSPDDDCFDVFNTNDGYGLGVDDAIIEINRSLKVDIRPEECYTLAASHAPLRMFVSLVASKRIPSNCE